MADIYGKINDLFKYDPGKRGIAGNVSDTDIAGLTEEIYAIKRAFIITGFTIAAVGAGETDGPGGAANIARALRYLNKEVYIITDSYSYGQVKAACNVLVPDAEVFCVPKDRAEDYCISLLKEYEPSHIIAIERPGKHNGHYYNMRCQIIDDYTAATDVLFTASNAVKIAIGDGGNELGMGSIKDIVEKHVSNGSLICSDEKSDFTLTAGVSNWWGWGIAAIISIREKKNILPDENDEIKMLRAVIDSGGVDGVTKKREMSVDNLSIEENLEFLNRLNILVENCIRNNIKA